MKPTFLKNNTTAKILTLSLPVQWLLVQFIARYPTWVEKYYAQGIYPAISKLLRFAFGWLPFSVGDILIFLVLAILLKNSYKLIKTRRFHVTNTLFKTGRFMAVLFFFFYINWGFNYFRNPLVKNLAINNKPYTTEELLVFTKLMVEKTNALQIKITRNDSLKVNVPYTHQEIYGMAHQGYKNLAAIFPQFHYTQTSIKSSLLSTFQSYIGVAGYLNPLTGEAHVNSLAPKTSAPVTTCHEMAHQIGYAAENEANFIGFLAATHHHNPYFKYAGYKMALGYALNELYYRDPLQHKAVYKTLHKGIVKDFKASSLFWKRYKNPITPFVKKGYSYYLKANKQTDGIKSYNYVVDLLISHFKKTQKNY